MEINIGGCLGAPKVLCLPTVIPDGGRPYYKVTGSPENKTSIV